MERECHDRFSLIAVGPQSETRQGPCHGCQWWDAHISVRLICCASLMADHHLWCKAVSEALGRTREPLACRANGRHRRKERKARRGGEEPMLG